MFKKFVALSLAILLSILCIPIQGVQAQEEALINYILVDKPQVDPGDTTVYHCGDRKGRHADRVGAAICRACGKR